MTVFAAILAERSTIEEVDIIYDLMRAYVGRRGTVGQRRLMIEVSTAAALSDIVYLCVRVPMAGDK